MEQCTVHILYTRISRPLSPEIYRKHLIFLPESLRDQHFRYRRWQDRASNLFSKVLLLKGLEKFGFDFQFLENLRYTEYNRPFLPGNIDFNISHSGEYMLCAIAQQVKVGIDIEEVKPVDFAEFESLMTAQQWHVINTSPTPLKTFFKYWAIKESIIKADGRGLSIPLNDIQINGQVAYFEKTWYLKELHFDENYCASLASDVEHPVLNVEYLDIYSQ